MQQAPHGPETKPELLPAPDPLWRNTPTPWKASYGLLGLPLSVETNAPVLAEQASMAFEHWGEPDRTQSGDPIRLRLLLHAAAEVLPLDLAPLMRAHDPYFLLSIGQSVGFADRHAGLAVAYVTPLLLDCPQTLRTCFVECLAMYLACGRGRAPLHASGLQWANRGVLLTGREGAGKSTLTYACLHAGFRLLADDIVYAPAPLSHEEPTLWGDARFLHLLPDALRFFPELRDTPCMQQMNSENKLQVSVGERWPDALLTHMPVAGVCSLGRSGSARARLLTADKMDLRHALTRFKNDPPLDADLQQATADRLLTGSIARLEVGTDLDHAVTMLKRWIERIG